MKLLLILTVFLTSLNLSAVTPIKKGEVSPQDGYIFSHEEEKKVRKIREDKLKLEDLNVLKDDKIAIQSERIAILKEQNKDLKFMNKYGKFVYYIMGGLMTGLSIYVGSKVSREMR